MHIGGQRTTLDDVLDEIATIQHDARAKVGGSPVRPIWPMIDHVANKKAEIVRVYLPPDTNTLLSVTDHCLRSRDYVNVIVAGKQPALTYLGIDRRPADRTRSP
jgi:phosphoketolase